MTADGSTFKIQYQNQSGTWNPGYDGDPGALQIGIESVGSSSGLQVASATYPTNGLAIQINLSVDPSFDLTDLSANWNDNSKNGGFFLSASYPKGITANISNNGTTDINSAFNVSTTISELAGGNATTYNTSVSSIQSGDNLVVSHSPALVLENFTCGGNCDAGTYIVTTDIGFSDDY